MSEIFHLVYSSKATSVISKNELEDILKVAREKNSAQEISGLLLHRSGHFIQLLEGDENQVYQIYNRIKKDPRHKDVLILAEFHSQARLFGNWSMGSIQDESENEKIVKKLEQLLGSKLGYQDNMKTQVIQIFRQVNQKSP